MEFSAKAASQLSSITTNRCWQLDSLEMQSNHLGRLILLLETPEIRSLCTPDSSDQVNEGYSPCPGEKCPQVQTARGKSPWRLEQWFQLERSSHHIFGNDWGHFGCHNLEEEGAPTGIQWVKPRGAAKHL